MNVVKSVAILAVIGLSVFDSAREMLIRLLLSDMRWQAHVAAPVERKRVQNEPQTQYQKTLKTEPAPKTEPELAGEQDCQQRGFDHWSEQYHRCIGWSQMECRKVGFDHWSKVEEKCV